MPEAPLRVALVCRPAAGGISTHIATLLNHLDRSQVSPLLAAPMDFLLPACTAPQQRVTVPIRSDFSPLHDLRAAAILTSSLRGKIDIIHAHGLRGAMVGGLAARWMQVPFLFTAHNLVDAKGVGQRSVIRLLGKSANRIIAVSEAVKTSLISNGVATSKIVVIPNGIDLHLWDKQLTGAPPPIPSIDLQTGYVLGLGRLSREKGFDLLIHAFSEVVAHFPAMQLVIVGDGPERGALEELAKERFGLQTVGKSSPIHFTGRLENPAPLIAGSCIVCIPSRAEGQGIVALEAMASRKPVIAMSVGGLPETVIANVTGLLIPPESVPDLAHAILSLIDSQGIRLKMGEEGRRKVEADYNSSSMASVIIQEYAECRRG